MPLIPNNRNTPKQRLDKNLRNKKKSKLKTPKWLNHTIQKSNHNGKIDATNDTNSKMHSKSGEIINSHTIFVPM